MCIGCSDCFGCVGLRNKKYHILNKPYSEGDYRELKAQIIKAMSSPSNPVDERYGEFLPIRLSMFPYNDSDAMLFFPSNKSEVKQLGARWAEDLDTSKYQISDWSIIPDRTSDLPEDLCSKAFECPTSGKAFKITARELAIYKKSKIPIPSKHWLIRIEERNFFVAPRYE